MNEWTTYGINIPARSISVPADGLPLQAVHHVVHLPAARRILEDGCLRGGLIYDESKLKESRICVTWLSANTWATGSIYGNVQFAFPWRNQIRRRHCYWVEAMTAYSPKAYRILLTDRDLSQSNRRPRNAPKGLIRAVWFPPLYSLPSCHGKGTKTSAESFLIDTGISEASIWNVAQRPLTKGVDFPDPRRHGCHW